ncbi:MAG: extracellular solute-binding protein [Angelakisella sp.]|nr:extracellular solute-binding protein [Angelakisella sp.]
MKRLLACILAATLSLSVLAGCSNSSTPSGSSSTASQSAPGKVTVKFINGFTGGDGAFMTKIVDSFNASQDQYYVEQLITADHYTKFKTDDFDMLIIHADRISTYHADGLLREVSDIYNAAGLSLENDFHTITQTYAKYDDGVFAFPLDLYADTMYYNKELVKNPPKTYDDILALKTELDSEKSGVYPVAIPLSGDNDWLVCAMLYQNNVNFIEDGHLKLDTDEAAEALLKLNKMIYSDKISAPNMAANDDINAFLKKSEGGTNIQAALSLTGPWNFTAAKETLGDNLGIAPFPTLGDSLAVPAGGHTFAVSAKVTDQAKLDAIAAFLKYAYTPDVMLNWADSGQAPIHLATMEKVKADPVKYPVAAVNYQIFDNARILPAVYNIREQMSYVYSTVWELIYSVPDLTKEALMEELKNATEIATELSVQ